MLGRVFERIHAALWVASVLLRTELGRAQNMSLAIINDETGRYVVRRKGSWDGYEDARE